MLPSDAIELPTRQHEREILARRYVRRWWATAVGANTLAGFVVAIAGVFAFRMQGGPAYADVYRRVVVGSVLPYFAFAVVTAWFVAGRVARQTTLWLRSGAPADERVRAEIASVPWRGAIISAVYWILLSAITVPALVSADDYRLTPVRLATIVSASLVGAAGGGTLTYLALDRYQQRLRRLAMRGAEVRPARRGILRLLLLGYLAGTVLPLLIVDVIVAGAERPHLELLRPYVWVASTLILLLGLGIVIAASRTVSEPVGRVRAALARVQRGDLDAEVAVDEAGEIGELMAGFNAMVAGLRERERMRDVFGRHVGPEVARRAMESDLSLGGDTREATALFVDVIGSSVLAQRETPQEVVAKLNRFFEAVVRSVDSEGGFVNKFQGDGALCVFGAPDDHPDHAARALRTACKIRAELTSIDGIDAAIGISSGTVVAGNVGAADRYEFTIIGDPVNEASRLTEQAKATDAKVLASARTLDAAAPTRGWREAGTFALRGRREATTAFEPA